MITTRPEILSVSQGNDYVNYYELNIEGINFQQGSPLIVDGKKVQSGSPLPGERDRLVFILQQTDLSALSVRLFSKKLSHDGCQSRGRRERQFHGDGAVGGYGALPVDLRFFAAPSLPGLILSAS